MLSLKKNYIDNFDLLIEGEKRCSITPIFEFKISTSMRMKTEDKQSYDGSGLELYFDEDTGEYILRPISNTMQRSFFDGDFEEVNDSNDVGPKLLEG